MATHLWLFPWLALVAGVAALLLGILSARANPTSPPGPPPPLPFYAVWVLATFALACFNFRWGASGAEFVTARGLVLGALGGWALAEIGRRRVGPASPPIIFGLATALAALARLWLTHGEVSGLTALAVGAGLAVLCLGVAPALLSKTPGKEESGGEATVGLLFLTSLVAVVQIGFTRATALGQEFWADVPLLLGAALALGSAASGGLLARTRLPRALPPLLGATLIVLLPLTRLAPSWRPWEEIGLGAVVFGLLARTGRDPDDRLGPMAGFVLLAAGAALAFALGSGYGLGLLVLGGWLAAGVGLLTGPARRAGRAGVGFAAVLLVYRLATLQNGQAVRASGPGDVWDLFAICLGALLPLLASEWAAQDGRAGRMAPWAVLGQWAMALIVPALLLDYVWQPRSVAGILLGAAVGQILASLTAGARAVQNAVAVSGVLLGLMLFQFLPLAEHVNEPTRAIRIGLVLLGAGLLLLRLLAAGVGPARTGEGKEEPDGVTSSPRA